MNQKLPVLLVTYNRPLLTSKVLKTIVDYKPSALYVASDGPKEDEIDQTKVREVRQIFDLAHFDFDVQKRYSSHNQGCAVGVKSALDWFFSNEEEGIILEDDCLPDPTFFKFCEVLIPRYRNSLEIVHISGNNFQKKARKDTEDYYFSIFNHIWGWATWRRTWEKYDHNIDTIDTMKLGSFVKNKDILKYFVRLFDKAFRNEIDTWDFRYMYSCWINQGISILPKRNLVSNIGFGADATHTNTDFSKQYVIEKEKLSFPLNHPAEIKVNTAADNYTYHHVYNRNSSRLSSFFEHLSRTIKR